MGQSLLLPQNFFLGDAGKILKDQVIAFHLFFLFPTEHTWKV